MIFFSASCDVFFHRLNEKKKKIKLSLNIFFFPSLFHSTVTSFASGNFHFPSISSFLGL